jgi:hypothetical protein
VVVTVVWGWRWCGAGGGGGEGGGKREGGGNGGDGGGDGGSSGDGSCGGEGGGMGSGVARALVGTSSCNSTEFRNYSYSGTFELWNFHQNLIFLIVKCVPANSEHVPASLESSPTINSSNFMN